MNSMPTFKILLILIPISLFSANIPTINCYTQPIQCESHLLHFLKVESPLTIYSDTIENYYIKKILKKRLKKEPITLYTFAQHDTTMRYLLKFKRLNAYRLEQPLHFTLLCSNKMSCVTNFSLHELSRHHKTDRLWCFNQPITLDISAKARF